MTPRTNEKKDDQEEDGLVFHRTR